MEKDFDLFMSQLQETNLTLEFFCDFAKIAANVDDIRLSLCMLNSLIGTTNLRRSVETIWRHDRSAFQVLDILIAVRDGKKKQYLNDEGHVDTLGNLFGSVDGIVLYLQKTGLAKVLQEGRIKDLVDYVFGVETGLDTNARKNRSGDAMAHTVASLLRKNGVKFRQEVESKEWPAVTRALGVDKKRFDFVVDAGHTTYLIEVNFYSSGGSKLNEVARSYSEIAPRINAVAGFEFVWITDGVGWRSARNKLQEAYDTIPSLYNLTNIGEFIMRCKEHG